MNIVKKASPNYTKGRRGYKPDMIVCHITDGSYAGAVSWLCNTASGVSSHYVLSRKGEVTQLVDLENYAYCNGTSTSPSKSNYYGNSSNRLVRERKTNANYYTVNIELEGYSTSTKGALTPVQFDALVELIDHIRTEVKKKFNVDIPLDREHIIGHNEISPKTKPYCPGLLFPWAELMNELTPVQELDVTVTTTTLNIYSGKTLSKCSVYNILYKNQNYIRLRDLCGLINCEVGYTNIPYVVPRNPVVKKSVSTADVVEDDIAKLTDIEIHQGTDVFTRSVLAINVEGTNYIKFRDLCDILGVTPGYNTAERVPEVTV